MEQAISMQLPIVAVNLNGLRQQDSDRCPPVIRNELALHISFRAAVLQEALETWPISDARLRREGRTDPYFFKNEVYARLGVAS